MAKLTLTNLTTLENEQVAIGQINSNSASIEAALENTLSRDGTSPNQMNADLDLNSNRIINLPAPLTDTEPVRKADVALQVDLDALLEARDQAVEAAEDAEFWADQAEAIAGQTAAAVTFTPAGNISAVNVQAAIQELDTEKVTTTRTVTGVGLASGGGSLATDQTIQVTAASQAEAEAGLLNTVSMTPLRVAQAIAALTPAGLPSGFLAMWPMNNAPTGWYIRNGQTLTAVGDPALFSLLVRYSTVTITLNTPGVFTWTNHGLQVNDPVKFITTGALPTGITAGTTYYIATAPTADTFTIKVNLTDEVSVNTSGSQSGVHTAIHAPYGCANDLSTFNLMNDLGLFERGVDRGRGYDLNRSIGSEQNDMFKAHNHSASANSTQSNYGGGPGSAGTGPFGTFTGTTGGVETRPRNRAYLPIIKR